MNTEHSMPTLHGQLLLLYPLGGLDGNLMQRIFICIRNFLYCNVKSGCKI